VRLFKFLWRVVDTYLLGFLYPSYCVSCHIFVSRDTFLCIQCDKKIKPIVSTYVPITAKQKLKVFAVSDYKDPLRSLILRKRFSDMLASKQLAQLMYEKTVIKNSRYDYIIPIPLHWTRRIRRGYNQAEVMAKDIGKRMNVPVLDIVERNKMTKFQSHLPVKERAENVQGAFRIKKKYLADYKALLKDKRILLVDDLCTTGSTLKQTARLFIDLKPQVIEAVVACRVI
jgi:competence protein ComFC